MKYLYTYLLIIFCNITSAQKVGSKISFVNVDGKTETGVVTSVWFKHYKVKSDKNQKEFWLNPNQITLLKSDTLSSYTTAITNNTSDKSKSEVLTTNDMVNQSSTTRKEGKADNLIGSKVWVIGADGGTYTGTITDSTVENYKVKYDSSNDEAWADKNVFDFVNPSSTTQSKVKQVFKKGDKVEFDLYGDGTQWVPGTVIQVTPAITEGCLVYKVNYQVNKVYMLSRNCKQVRPLIVNTNKIKVKDSVYINTTEITTSIDSSLLGDYACFKPVWNYITKTSSWEPQGIVTINPNGTYLFVSEGFKGNYKWDSLNNQLIFFNPLEGVVGIPSKIGNRSEIKIVFETKPPKKWICSQRK